ncbi:hypothetical protein ACX8XP_09720 [Calditrichota bacterium LG25]
MKRSILFLLLFIFITNKTVMAQNYSVKIKVNDVWWESKENYGAFLQAEIYDGNNLLSPNSDYYYTWYVYFSREGYWKILKEGYGDEREKFGADEASPETLPGYYIKAYVIVTDNVNHTFENLTSNTTDEFFMSGLGKVVTISAFDEQGNNLSSYFKPKHWRYTINEWKDYYSSYGNSFLTQDYNERIKAFPELLTEISQKFNYWNNDVTDIQNYNDFYIESTTDEIASNYKNSVASVVIKNLFISGTVSGDSIYFKDPWLVDMDNNEFYFPPYGYRSLGMSAPFVKDESPLNPNYTTKYKGVFLDQGYENGVWNPPYYSVKAEARQTFTAHGQQITGYFLNWEGTDVTFQHADQQETPLVFHAANAEARAVYKGHLASSAARATGYNNGRIAL